MLKRYVLYLIRWQLSTPILAFSLVFFNFGVTWNTIIANFIGGLIFFWVDRFIFTARILSPHWEVAENIKCTDCNKQVSRGYRLTKSVKYDRTNSAKEFRCETCSHTKALKTRESGVETYSVV